MGWLSQYSQQKWLISAWLRQRFERTKLPYRIGDRGENGQLPTGIREPTILDKLDRALLMVANESHEYGDKVRLHVQRDIVPLAWAKSTEEARNIVEYLASTNQVQRFKDEEDVRRLVLTVQGWRRVEELRPIGRKGTQAFVAMAFCPDTEDAYWKGIQPALQACGYQSYRVDQDLFDGKIDDVIIAQLRRSALCLVDLTRHRPNVYFEAGYAMGRDIPVIFTCAEEDKDNVGFDTRQYPRIHWSSPERLGEELVRRIQALYPLSGHTPPLPAREPALGNDPA